MVFGVMGNHVIRWRSNLREAAHAVLRITQPAEWRQHEAGCGRRAGRKDLHICQKHRTAATIPGPGKIPRPAPASGPGERRTPEEMRAAPARPWGMNVTTRPLWGIKLTFTVTGRQGRGAAPGARTSWRYSAGSGRRQLRVVPAGAGPAEPGKPRRGRRTTRTCRGGRAGRPKHPRGPGQGTIRCRPVRAGGGQLPAERGGNPE